SSTAACGVWPSPRPHPSEGGGAFRSRAPRARLGRRHEPARAPGASRDLLQRPGGAEVHHEQPHDGDPDHHDGGPISCFPERPCLLLDIGCGSGISGQACSDAGHVWIGYDISPSMLRCANDGECEGGPCRARAGPRFRPGTFDGAVSISALQWLCNVDRKGHEPFRRLKLFFERLFSCLRKGARAALQFYP
ncbi:unnamed protein product, partial [Prorocentrum cordatum]